VEPGHSGISVNFANLWRNCVIEKAAPRLTFVLLIILLIKQLITKIMNAGKLLLGVLAGAAVGAVLGVLFAPEKGSTTRKKISRKRDEVAYQLEDKFDEFINGVADKFEAVKEEAVRMAKKTKRKLDETEDQVIASAK
jgi:gas vesicle protein